MARRQQRIKLIETFQGSRSSSGLIDDCAMNHRGLCDKVYKSDRARTCTRMAGVYSCLASLVLVMVQVTVVVYSRENGFGDLSTALMMGRQSDSNNNDKLDHHISELSSRQQRPNTHSYPIHPINNQRPQGQSPKTTDTAKATRSLRPSTEIRAPPPVVGTTDKGQPAANRGTQIDRSQTGANIKYNSGVNNNQNSGRIRDNNGNNDNDNDGVEGNNSDSDEDSEAAPSSLSETPTTLTDINGGVRRRQQQPNSLIRNLSGGRIESPTKPDDESDDSAEAASGNTGSSSSGGSGAGEPVGDDAADDDANDGSGSSSAGRSTLAIDDINDATSVDQPDYDGAGQGNYNNNGARRLQRRQQQQPPPSPPSRHRDQQVFAAHDSTAAPPDNRSRTSNNPSSNANNDRLTNVGSNMISTTTAASSLRATGDSRRRVSSTVPQQPPVPPSTTTPAATTTIASRLTSSLPLAFDVTMGSDRMLIKPPMASVHRPTPTTTTTTMLPIATTVSTEEDVEISSGANAQFAPINERRQDLLYPSSNQDQHTAPPSSHVSPTGATGPYPPFNINNDPLANIDHLANGNGQATICHTPYALVTIVITTMLVTIAVCLCTHLLFKYRAKHRFGKYTTVVCFVLPNGRALRPITVV